MCIQEILFSPTGGTQKAAACIADELCVRLGLEKRTVDLTDYGTRLAEVSVRSDDIAVIAVPSYGGRVPETCAGRIGEISGCGARAILVCVYGNRAYDDTLLELSDLAEKSGFRTIAAIAAVAEHSIARKYAAGRPDAADCRELAAFANQIGEKIASGKALPEAALRLPGNRPYKKASAGGMVPKAGSGCTQCGLCAVKCPVQAISRSNPRAVDAEKCISCMRCISVCPTSARKISPVMLLAVEAALKKACSGRKENELYL